MSTLSTTLFQGVSNIKKKGGKDVPIAELERDGGVIGLYFSAHWCPPCRGFTPKLAEWYTNLTDGPLKGKLEIVFVSSDRDQAAFDEYFESMPWLALPFELRDAKAALSKKFKVQGIPTLVFVNAATGDLITKNGRNIVGDDPQGKNFPWTPEPFDKIINGQFVNKDGASITWEDCKDKTVGLYFSAHWCPPCRGFTPQLATFYNEMKTANKNLEIIFVSSDNSDEEYKEYLDEMPWYAIPYDDGRKDKLDKLFEISGIPSLIILEGATGKVITENGRSMVSADPKGEDFPWHPKALEALHGGKVDDVNERVCMIWFTDGSDDQITQAKTAMDPVATPYFEANKDNDDAVVFMYAKNDSLAERLQQFVQISPPFPVLALVNMTDQVKYICDDSNLTEDTVRKFLEDYQQEKLTSKTFKE